MTTLERRHDQNTAQNGVQRKAGCDDACVSGHKNPLA
jgi:hypothetical protein